MDQTSACSKLRSEIKRLAVPDSDDVPRDKQFYPLASLRALFSRKRVQEVVCCSCPSCKRAVEDLRSPDDTERICDSILDPRLLTCLNGNSMVCLFGLLTYIECPKFIAPFLRLHQRGDLPWRMNELSEKFLKTRVWPKFDKKHARESHDFASEFHWQKFKFLVSSIDNEYEEFDRNAILPFVNERPLDEGAFGKVYSFEISGGYRHNLAPPEIRRFARKELRTTIQIRFQAERANLELIKGLQDPHLISIIKAYKHGDIFNFIFPCARTNLDKYLRDRQLQSPSMFSDRIETHPFLLEMLGVAEALQKIHSCSIPSNNKRFDLFGYHFDIKPANILVMDSGKFVITDFGQANFKQQNGTSRVTGMGGTEAYAPPEIEQKDAKPNRKYDVWSLGCVFLEICSFIALQHKGVEDLDDLKLSRSTDGRREYESFYQQDMVPGTYRIKPEIFKWMKKLPDSPHIQDGDGCVLMQNMMGIVAKMLEVKIEDRSTSQDVCTDMHGLIDQFRPIERVATDLQIGNVALSPDEFEIGPATIPALAGLSYSTQGMHSHGPIRISENANGAMNMMSSQDGRLSRHYLGLRKDIYIIPRYAFPSDEGDGFLGSRLVLASLNSQSHRDALPVQFTTEDIRTAPRLQSSLLGQVLQRSLTLNGVCLNHKVTSLAKLFGRKSQGPTGNVGRAVVQLWHERPLERQHAFGSPQRSQSGFRLSQQAIEGAAKRRIVIICASSIYVITLSKASRLQQLGSNDDPLTLQLVPTDKKTKPTITTSQIGFECAGSSRALPLDRDIFLEQEAKGNFQCQSVSLTFQCHDDLHVFRDTYQSMKESWSFETDQIQRARLTMGQTVGRAPN